MSLFTGLALLGFLWSCTTVVEKPAPSTSTSITKKLTMENSTTKKSSTKKSSMEPMPNEPGPPSPSPKKRSSAAPSETWRSSPNPAFLKQPDGNTQMPGESGPVPSPTPKSDGTDQS